MSAMRFVGLAVRPSPGKWTLYRSAVVSPLTRSLRPRPLPASEERLEPAARAQQTEGSDESALHRDLDRACGAYRVCDSFRERACPELPEQADPRHRAVRRRRRGRYAGP